MSFGLFVGVNNHFQRMIFGEVLTREEKIKDFEEIFWEFAHLFFTGTEFYMSNILKKVINSV